MALETVLIAALLLAHLAVPSELLQTLGLDPVGDGLGRQEAGLLLAHPPLSARLAVLNWQ